MNANTGDSGGDGNQSDSKKGKRELSTSKRAAQNRAAQVRLLSYHEATSNVKESTRGRGLEPLVNLPSLSVE